MVRKNCLGDIILPAFIIVLLAAMAACSNASKQQAPDSPTLTSSNSVSGSFDPFGGDPPANSNDDIVNVLFNSTSSLNCNLQVNYPTPALVGDLDSETTFDQVPITFTASSTISMANGIYIIYAPGTILTYSPSDLENYSVAYIPYDVPEQNSNYSNLTFLIEVLGEGVASFWWGFIDANSGEVCKTAPDMNQMVFQDSNQTNSSNTVELVLNELKSVTFDSGVQLFGHVFAPGHFQPGEVTIANQANTTLPTQVHVLKQHPDGSIRHALFGVATSLVANERKILRIVPEANAELGGTFNWGMNSGDFINGTKLRLSNSNGTYKSDLGDILSSLQNCTAIGGASGAWAQRIYNGNNFKTCEIWSRLRNPNGSWNEHLDVRWTLTNYNNGGVDIEVAVENTHVKKYGNTFSNYDFNGVLEIGTAGVRWTGQADLPIATRWSLPIQHYGAQNIDALVQIDHDYWVNTAKVIQDYQSTMDNSVIQKIQSSNFIPPGEDGEIVVYMPTTGGASTIGLYRRSARRAIALADKERTNPTILSQIGQSALGYYEETESIVNNGMGSIFDVHHRQSRTSNSQSPGGRIGIECGNWDAEEHGGNSDAIGSEDRAHQPPKNFFLALLRPQIRSNLDMIHFWLMFTFPGDYPSGDCMVKWQTRARAWAARDINRAAWMTPDDHELRPTIDWMLQNWIDGARDLTVDAGFPVHYNIWSGAETSGLIQSGQQHYTNGTRVPLWQHAWLCSAFAETVRFGYTDALDIAQWICKEMIDDFTAIDDPAHDWVHPITGEVWKADWRKLAGSDGIAEYFTESVPNSIPCDSNVWTVPDDYNWTKQFPVNKGHKYYLSRVANNFKGFPTPDWCPSYSNGSAMTFWDAYQPGPNENNPDPSWFVYSFEHTVASLKRLVFEDSGATYLGLEPIEVTQAKVLTLENRYLGFTSGEDYDPLAVFTP